MFDKMSKENQGDAALTPTWWTSEMNIITCVSLEEKMEAMDTVRYVRNRVT